MRRSLMLLVATVIVVLVTPVAAMAAEAGDEPDTAITVGAGTARFDSTDMTESSADPDACDPFPGPVFNTMWFSYEAGRSASTVVDVNSFVSEDGSTDYLAVVFVYRDDGGSLSLVGCSAFPATVNLVTARGARYVIMVAGLSTAATEDPPLSDRGGTFDLTIEPIQGRVLRDHFHDAGTFTDEEFCSEPIELRWDDNVYVKTFMGRDGPVRFTVFIQGTTWFTAPDGSTLALKYAQTFTDGLDGTASYVGLPQDVWLDGEHVVRDVGRLVFDTESGDVIFDAGDHPQWYEGLDICGLLGLETAA